MSVHGRQRKKVRICISNCKKSRLKKKREITKKRFEHCNTNKTKSENHDPRKTQNLTIERCKHLCRRYEQFHDNFLNYDQIVTFLGNVHKKKPQIVDLVTIGHSGEGKPIYMVLITGDSRCVTGPKHAVFIEAGLNGQDAFAVSNALYIIDYLSQNPNYTKIMDYFIAPCGNPDAYDRFIRSKTKSDNKCGVKRTKSNDDTQNKKPRLQSPQNKRQEPKNTSCHCNKCLGIGKRDYSYKDFHCTYFRIKTKLKKCLPKLRNANYHKVEKENNEKSNNNSNIKEDDKCSSFRMDLSSNFPVILGLNDMRRIPTDEFLKKIRIWKENFLNSSPETYALLKAIHSCQFAVKLLISLQEGGETICYPYGFCDSVSEDSNDLQEVARKGKHAITKRRFQCGPIHEVRGLTYGSLIDFIKVDRGSIKNNFIIQVHKKTPCYNEKQELKKLMTYGWEIMQCIKSMSLAVFKSYTNMTGNRKVETECTKPGLNRRTYS